MFALLFSLASSLTYRIPVTKLLDNPDRYLPVVNTTFTPYLTNSEHQFLLEVNQPGDMAFNFDCTTSLAEPNGCQQYPVFGVTYQFDASAPSFTSNNFTGLQRGGYRSDGYQLMSPRQLYTDQDEQLSANNTLYMVQYITADAWLYDVQTKYGSVSFAYQNYWLNQMSMNLTNQTIAWSIELQTIAE